MDTDSPGPGGSRNSNRFQGSSQLLLLPVVPLLRGHAFLVVPLATLEWYYAYSGQVQTRKLFLLLSIGIVTTLGTAFHTTLLMVAAPCAPGVSGGGFPLPWYLTFILYTGRGPYPPCPLFIDRPWGVFATFSFLFDTIFYAAFAIAGNEFYRWEKRQNTLTGDPKPGSNMHETNSFP